MDAPAGNQLEKPNLWGSGSRVVGAGRQCTAWEYTTLKTSAGLISEPLTSFSSKILPVPGK